MSIVPRRFTNHFWHFQSVTAPSPYTAHVLHFSCVFTFLEIIKHDTSNMCIFSIKMIAQKFINFYKFFKILIFREGGREKGKCQWEISCALLAPSWGPGLQPRHVPWLGIEPATFSVHRSALKSTEPHQPGWQVFFNAGWYDSCHNTV